ncbi:MAG: HTTM domain-containing protein, partial [Chloroflexota bacterium]|nr:HTTM domain-containing protein [Chloroflexota bacterium]
DLVSRAPNLSAHYTDTGVLPRYALLQELPSRWRFSLHLLSGDAFVQAALFILAGLAALALLVGLRTRLMTVVVWVFLISLHGRNPLVLSAADVLLRMLFFWGMFLPLGAYWSVDSIRAPAPRRLSPQFFSFATVGLFAQIAFVYWFGALHKSGPEWRVDGTAIYYALSIEAFVTPFGAYLRQFPTLLQLMTFGVFWFEALGPLLLFCPVFTGPLRIAGVLGFMVLHFGIWLTMILGLFQAIAALAMVCFLPAWFWDKASELIRAASPYLRGDTRRFQHLMAGLVRRPLSPVVAQQTQPQSSEQPFQAAPAAWNGLAMTLVRWQAVLRRGVPAASGTERTAPQHAASDVASGPHRLRSSAETNLWAACFLAYIFFWNLSTVSGYQLPASLKPLGTFLRLDQSWSMFSPYPSKADVWFVIPGTLRSGAQLDLSAVPRGDFGVYGVTWEKPHPMFKDKAWRKYLMQIRRAKHKDLRFYLGRYLCRAWNAQHDGAEQLERLQIYYMLEPTLPDYRSAEPKKVLLGRYRCV